jgi:putative transposase
VTVRAVCERVGMSRQAYYQARRERQRREIDEEAILKLVDAERRLQPRMGARKILTNIRPELAAMGVEMGRDRFFDLLRRHGRLVESLPAAPRTTWVDRTHPVAPNLLDGLKPTGPNEAWAADITYVRTREGWAYASLITDVFSRKIVGHALWNDLTLEGPLTALERALAGLPDGATPLHHSDRGCQYTSTPYRDRLAAAGLAASMTETNHCYQNALAERVNGILKQEYGLRGEFASKAQARRALDQAVELYNTRRPHVSLRYRTPEAVHREVA